MNANENYLNIQVQSATPGGLIVLLHDGLIRFASEAKEELVSTNAARSRRAAELVDRCIRILTELNCSLRWDVDPQFCTRLSELYTFFTDQLSRAVRESKPEAIGEILPLIEQLRDGWYRADQTRAPIPEATAA